MIVSEKKKLNKFQQRSIPRNKDLFSRVGSRDFNMHDDGQIADYNGRLVDRLAGSLDDFETQMLRESQMPTNTPSAQQKESGVGMKGSEPDE